MRYHLPNEVVIAYKRSHRPDLIFASTRLRDNEFLQNDLLQCDEVADEFLVTTYSIINSPSVHQSMLLMERTTSPLDAFDLCMHQNDKNVRNAFIEKIIETEHCSTGFEMLPNRTFDEEMLFLTRIDKEFVASLFWQCDFRHEKIMRTILLKRSTQPVVILSQLDNVTMEEIKMVADREKMIL